MLRLQKLLAERGVASRRAAEQLIRQGRVTVNGRAVTRPGTLVDPVADAVKVDGRRLPARPASRTYLMLNKPRGVVTTVRDPRGRPTVIDLLRGVKARVFPVGRLDFHSEGLLLLTDDGDLARNLTHPGRGVPRTYRVKVRGQPAPESLRRLARGIVLEGKKTLPARLRVARPGRNAWIEVTVVEGRKHHVRRMLAAVGHPVMRLRRTAFGGVTLGSLPAGRFRRLSAAELSRLRRAAELDTRAQVL